MICKWYKDGFELFLPVPEIAIRKYLGVLAKLCIFNEVQIDVSTVYFCQATCNRVSCHYICHTKREFPYEKIISKQKLRQFKNFQG